MNTRHICVITLGCAALFGSCAADAQLRHIAPAPQPARQAPAPGVASFGLPSPSGLAPPGAPTLAPPGAPNVSAPGAAPGSPATDSGIAAPFTPGGGGGVIVLPQAAAGGTNAMGAAAAPRGPVTAVDIARAFMEADTNHDGELSRAEAQRASSFLSMNFDELDRDHDGVLSRSEYEDAFQ